MNNRLDFVFNNKTVIYCFILYYRIVEQEKILLCVPVSLLSVPVITGIDQSDIVRSVTKLDTILQREKKHVYHLSIPEIWGCSPQVQRYLMDAIVRYTSLY